MARAITHRAIDASVLNELRKLNGADGRFLDEMIDLFLENVPPVLSSLKNAVQSNDAQAVKQLAHRLKGFCRNLGASEMSGLCENLEDKARALSLGGANDLLGSLYAEFDFVKSALDSERGHSK